MNSTYIDLLIAFAPSINSFSEAACAYVMYQIAVLAAHTSSRSRHQPRGSSNVQININKKPPAGGTEIATS